MREEAAKALNKVCPACQVSSKFEITASNKLQCKKCLFELGSVESLYSDSIDRAVERNDYEKASVVVSAHTLALDYVKQNLCDMLGEKDQAFLLEFWGALESLTRAKPKGTAFLTDRLNDSLTWSLTEIRKDIMGLDTAKLCELYRRIDPEVMKVSYIPVTDNLLFFVDGTEKNVMFNLDYVRVMQCAKVAKLDKLVDLHSVFASALFGVPYRGVTPKQRDFAKAYLIRGIYDRPLLENPITEPTHCRLCTQKLGHDDDGYNECRFCNAGYVESDSSNTVTASTM